MIPCDRLSQEFIGRDPALRSECMVLEVEPLNHEIVEIIVPHTLP